MFPDVSKSVSPCVSNDIADMARRRRVQNSVFIGVSIGASGRVPTRVPCDGDFVGSLYGRKEGWDAELRSRSGCLRSYQVWFGFL